MISKYRVRCVGGGEFIDDQARLSCPNGHDSLLRTEYASRQLRLTSYPGIFRYLGWLPVTRPLVPSGGPVAFANEALSRELGLLRLTISFSGYCPELGADLASGSFKELEALPTMQRLLELGGKIPVIASAGNTGRAFCEISAQCRKPVVIVVPDKALVRLWTTKPPRDIFLVTVAGDYSDAITVSGALAEVPGCVAEGGAKNIARRDGMGTVMLDAAVRTGSLPDHYFQAVGSGTGGIAAWEAAMRLGGDGRYGTTLPRLHLAQNEPFIPMVSAWNDHRRGIIPEIDMPDACTSINRVMSDVLTNRNPPYSIRGGLFDALTATRGRMYAVSNAEGTEAQKIIQDFLGFDPDPAAAIAAAALTRASDKGIVRRDDRILLNITGGGYERIKEDFELYPIEPAVRLKTGEGMDEIIKCLTEWITHYG
jgi:cysteate synthase